MTEVFDGFAQCVAAIGLVDGDLRHGEVGLGELSSSRVDANEDLGNGLNIKILCQLDQANRVVDDFQEPLERLANEIPIDLWIACHIGVGLIKQIRIRLKELRYVWNPKRILGDGRIAYFKAWLVIRCQRIECNSDPHPLVVLGQHLHSQQRGHQGSHPLLAVDQDALAGGGCAVLELDRGISPGN